MIYFSFSRSQLSGFETPFPNFVTDANYRGYGKKYFPRITITFIACVRHRLLQSRFARGKLLATSREKTMMRGEIRLRFGSVFLNATDPFPPLSLSLSLSVSLNLSESRLCDAPPSPRSHTIRLIKTTRFTHRKIRSRIKTRSDLPFEMDRPIKSRSFITAGFSKENWEARGIAFSTWERNKS